MSGVNGRLSDTAGPPIQLGDFLPERRSITINGQQYAGWVTTNRRYPRHIMAKLDKAARSYNRFVSPLLEPLGEGEEPDEARLRAAEDQPEAWAQYVTQAVLLLVPNLMESETELIDLPILEGLLRDLGYFPPLPQPDAPPSEQTEGEPVANEVAMGSDDPLNTGATSPDALPASTELVPLSN